MPKLTEMQQQVADLAGQGYNIRTIAERLGLRYNTVGVYLHNVYQLLGLNNDPERDPRASLVLMMNKRRATK
jgi:DNA-binding NarL/FixJ family response regulator